jgi:glycosyltransferase involved in cell wall biosynthesis
METIFIVCKEYDDLLAKKQPWYSIKKLHSDLTLLGFNVFIVGSLELVPPKYSGRVIKLFGFKDIFRVHVTSYKLIYLFTSPMITMQKFFSIGLNTTIKNWNYLYKIFAVSLVPKFWIMKLFDRACAVIVISDTSEDYFCHVPNLYKYIPFTPDNWCTGKKLSQNKRRTNKKIKLGYFGPPYLTRHFDSVVDFFVWLEKNSTKYEFKLVTRIDRDSVHQVQNKYLSKLCLDTTDVVSGFLSRDKLLQELLDIDVMILPFRVVMEELPIVVLEALELGIPVVTTKDSGINLITQGRKDVLILDEFSKERYQEILNFTDSYVHEDFDAILTKINEINKIPLGIICDL